MKMKISFQKCYEMKLQSISAYLFIYELFMHISILTTTTLMV